MCATPAETSFRSTALARASPSSRHGVKARNASTLSRDSPFYLATMARRVQEVVALDLGTPVGSARSAEMAEIEARAAALRAEAEGAIHDAEVRARQAAAELSRRSGT